MYVWRALLGVVSHLRGQAGMTHLGRAGVTHLGQAGITHLGQAGKAHLGQAAMFPAYAYPAPP